MADGVDGHLDGGAVRDRVNDNRQYLPSARSAARRPARRLQPQQGFPVRQLGVLGVPHRRYGNGLVLKTWKQAGSLKKDGGKNSLPALQKVLKRKGGLTKNYAQFAAGNLTPVANFPEGAEYPGPKVRGASC